MLSQCTSPLPPHPRCALTARRFSVAEFDEAALAAYNIDCSHFSEYATPKRRLEFVAGRICAHEALAQLGIDTPLRLDGDKHPIWPADSIGAITHSNGYAAAMVGRRTEIAGIGIDTEKRIADETAEKIQSKILSDGEKEYGQRLEDFPRYLTTLFSAKESLYKALYPSVKQFFGFHDALITLADHNRFRFQLTKSLTPQFPEGYCGEGVYCQDEEFIHTAIVIES